MAETMRFSKDLRLCIEYMRSQHDEEWNHLFTDSEIVSMFAREFLFNKVGLNKGLLYLNGDIDLRS